MSKHEIPIKLLIVEDDLDISDYFKTFFEENNCTVTSQPRTYQEGLESVELDLPDIIIMDIRLKGTKDGVDLAIEVRKKYKIPIIFYSEINDEDNRLEKTLEIKNNMYFVKRKGALSFDKKRILSHIKNVYKEHYPDPELKDLFKLLNGLTIKSVKHASLKLNIAYRDIYYFAKESSPIKPGSKKYTKKDDIFLYSKRGKFHFKGTVDKLEERLPNYFGRVNQSTIVNCQFIVEFDGTDISLDLESTQKNISVTNTFRSRFKNAIKKAFDDLNFK